MCGIVGKVWREAERPVDADIIARMQRCIVHRGPDEEGAYLAAPVGFGFQRLAIIDVACGHQPMQNDDGSVVLVFNGEIYNFPQLREELEGLGRRFNTRSDTETILRGYEQWGKGVVWRLRGMFAFAIWDRRTRTLLLARDRVGKKPLYFAHFKRGGADESLVFASELKAILADPAARRDVDLPALSHYLTYQYVPHPWSIYQGIEKLPPSHLLTYCDGELKIERYAELTYEPKRSVSLDDAAAEALAQLEEAARVRLMSEVPLGCFLSGGIDSSAVVAMMRKHIAGPLRTFSIGFREEAWNELPYARRVAEQFETQHEEFIVEANALECLGMLAWHFDEPFADTSAIPTYYLSKMTRQHVTVALNGDGGDESFAGYSRYKGFAAFNRYKKIPRALRQLMQKPSAWATAALPSNARLDLLAYANRVSLQPEERIYVETMVIFRDYQKSRLLSPGVRAALASGGASELITEGIMRDGRARDPIDKMMHADIEMYLPGALLPKVDRMTMAVSLEGRSPFLDAELMQWAARLPADVKFREGETKFLLKYALRDIFPRDFLYRPKMGFGVPIGDWFRGQLKPLLHEMLLGSRARQRGWLDMQYVERLVNDHVSGRHAHPHRLWSLLMLETWAQTFLDRQDPLAGPVEFAKL